MEGGFDGSGSDQPHVQQHHVVEIFGHGLQVVVHGDDGATAGAQFLEQGQNGPFGGGIHTGKGFVHEVDAGLLGERSGEKYPLLLAAGKLADLAIRELGNADLSQAFEGPFAVGPARSPEKAEVGVHAHHHHVDSGGGEIPVDTFSLRHVGHPGAPPAGAFAADFHPAADGFDEAEDRFEEGAFAGAVRTHDGDEFAFGQGDVDIPEHGLVVVGDGEVVDFDRDLFSGGFGLRLGLPTALFEGARPAHGVSF